MTMEEGGHSPTTLSPDEAFALLGNEARMEILRALGEAEGRLPFSELYERVGVRDSGQFNYHLDKLVGHFVRKTDDGYELRKAGSRVVEAVLSGAITDLSVRDPTRLYEPCPYCGGEMTVSYSENRLLFRCLDCDGAVRGGGTLEPFGPPPDGTIELLYLPSAGFIDRTLEEAIEASATRATVEYVSMFNGVCPRCSAPVEHSVRLCEGHEPAGICDRCDRRFGAYVETECVNCPQRRTGALLRFFVGEPVWRVFFESRGIDLFDHHPDEWAETLQYDEETLSTDPVEVRCTFTTCGDELVLTVDEDLSLTDVTERSGVDE